MSSLSDELISAYLDGELPADERERVERWIAEDAQAKQLCEELKVLRGSMAALPRLQLGGGFRAKVLSAALEAQQESLAAEAKEESLSRLVAAKSPIRADGHDVAGQDAAFNGEPVSRDTSLPPAEEGAGWRRWMWPLAAVAAAILIALFAPRDNSTPVVLETTPNPTATQGQPPAVPEQPAPPLLAKAGGQNDGGDRQDAISTAAATAPPPGLETAKDKQATQSAVQPNDALVAPPFAPPGNAVAGHDEERERGFGGGEGKGLSSREDNARLEFRKRLAASENEYLVVYVDAASPTNGAARAKGEPLAAALQASGIEVRDLQDQTRGADERTRHMLEQLSAERSEESGNREEFQLRMAQEAEAGEVIVVEIAAAEADALLGDLHDRGVALHVAGADRIERQQAEKAVAETGALKAQSRPAAVAVEENQDDVKLADGKPSGESIPFDDAGQALKKNDADGFGRVEQAGDPTAPRFAGRAFRLNSARDRAAYLPNKPGEGKGAGNVPAAEPSADQLAEAAPAGPPPAALPGPNASGGRADPAPPAPLALPGGAAPPGVPPPPAPSIAFAPSAPAIDLAPSAAPRMVKILFVLRPAPPAAKPSRP